MKMAYFDWWKWCECRGAINIYYISTNQKLVFTWKLVTIVCPWAHHRKFVIFFHRMSIFRFTSASELLETKPTEVTLETIVQLKKIHKTEQNMTTFLETCSYYVLHHHICFFHGLYDNLDLSYDSCFCDDNPCPFHGIHGMICPCFDYDSSSYPYLYIHLCI